MIWNNDRSYYIGASDTSYVVGNWETKSFSKWYGTKLGIYSNYFSNEAMQAGTAYEHKILDSMKVPGLEKDKQIIIYRLRVNLDGNTDSRIYEVKTYRFDKGFRVSKSYREQVIVEMYASNIKNACIVAYGLTEYDYRNFYNDIDHNRISFHEIKYDVGFINNIYLPRLEYLSECLDRGVFPKRWDDVCKHKDNKISEQRGRNLYGRTCA